MSPLPKGIESAELFPGSFQITSYEDSCFMMLGLAVCAGAMIGQIDHIEAIQSDTARLDLVFETIISCPLQEPIPGAPHA
jgi:hypothetical protein